MRARHRATAALLLLAGDGHRTDHLSANARPSSPPTRRQREAIAWLPITGPTGFTAARQSCPSPPLLPSILIHHRYRRATSQREHRGRPSDYHGCPRRRVGTSTLTMLRVPDGSDDGEACDECGITCGGRPRILGAGSPPPYPSTRADPSRSVMATLLVHRARGRAIVV